jgi:Rieske Fe-S protein
MVTPEEISPPSGGGGPGPDLLDTDNIVRFSRITMLRRLNGLSTGAFAVAFGIPAFAIKSLQTAVQEIASGDVLVYATAATGAAAGAPVKASDIQVGTSVQAFPKGKTDNQQNLVELVRIAPGQGKDGLVAYSAICTHLGCVVYARLNDAGEIACPCHASRYDPAKNAAVVGGPAPRPLPGLPIDVQQDGTVTAAGSFTAPVGVAS